MYRVLARTWRPQRFDELVGQGHVAQTLANAIRTDRLAHAYVFAGLRGTGKTTVARILAKCLNCEQGPTTTPCGSCVPCQEISESRAIDVLEIDAASRTKVEQTRELLELVTYAPVRDSYKVLIIDEAHMLSKASFNALLKTLEEPPPRVLFVLATTEIHKILPTILSRCQVFEFRRVTPAELTGHLRKVAEAEKIGVSDGALERIARAGEGSVRDSLSLLERVLAFCGSEVPDEQVLRILGAVKTQVLAEFVSGLAQRDAGRMLGVLDGLVDEGHDLVHFWNELIAALRDLLLARALPDRPELLSRSPDDAATLLGSANGLGREDLTRAFQILADLEPALKASSQPRYLFEAALVRLASLGAVRPIEELLETLSGGGDTGDPPAPPASGGTASSPAKPARQPATRRRAADPERRAASGRASGFRGTLLAALREARPMIAAMLDQAEGVTVDEARLDLHFPAGMEALGRQLERRENLQALKQHAERLAGRSLEVRVSVGSPAGHAAPAAADEVEAGPAGATAEKRPAAGAGDELLEQARREPGVQKLLDVFGGQVVEIRPLDGERPAGKPADKKADNKPPRRARKRPAKRPLEESP